MYSSYSAAYHREPSRVTAPMLLVAIAARPRLLLLVTAAVFGLFAVLVLTLPRGYVSHMELRLGPEDISSFPATGGANGVASKLASSLESRMKLETEVLESFDTLSQVVVKTGLQKIEVGGDQAIGETSTLTVAKAVQRLQEHLKINRPGGSNILELTYSGLTPEIAAATLGNMAAVYPKERVKVFGESGRYKFLHRQSTVWRRQMDEAETDLVHFRRRYSEFVLPEEREALGKRSVEAQAAFEQADAQVAQYRRKVAEAQEKVKALSPAKSEQNRAILNSAEINLISSENELAGFEALRNHLKGIAGEYKEQMFRLADAEIWDGALLRQVKQTEEQYLTYLKWQEQTVAAEGLAKESISEFGVVQRPTIPTEASTPHVGLDLLMSFLLAGCCGLAVVLCAEYLTPRALRGYAAVRTIPAEFEAV